MENKRLRLKLKIKGRGHWRFGGLVGLMGLIGLVDWWIELKLKLLT